MRFFAAIFALGARVVVFALVTFVFDAAALLREVLTAPVALPAADRAGLAFVDFDFDGALALALAAFARVCEDARRSLRVLVCIAAPKR